MSVPPKPTDASSPHAPPDREAPGPLFDSLHGAIRPVAEDPSLTGAPAQLQPLQTLETIGALAAGVAHDFNNLLLVIRGNVGLLLLDEKTDAATRARLNQVELAAARASDLTQRLLAIGRSAKTQNSSRSEPTRASGS